MRRRVLIGSFVTLAILLAGVLFAFAFGTPQAPPTPADAGVPVAAATEPAAGTVAPGSPGTDESVVATGEVPPPDPGSPLAVEIPGCVCHSDDPVLVEEHAPYRMNQCFGCHAGGMPEMGQ